MCDCRTDALHRHTAATPHHRACVEWNLFEVDTHSGIIVLDMAMRIHCSFSGILRADRADRARFSKRGRGVAEFDRVLCY